LPESQITGGSLGGVLRFRSETLDTAQNALGRIALTLAQNVNDQHRLGQDLTGALGTDFFNLSPRRRVRPAA
jgi:flagellar hook-associated protein 1 FlgK